MVPNNTSNAQDIAATVQASKTQKPMAPEENLPPAPLVIRNLSKRSRSAPSIEVVSVARSGSPIDVTAKPQQVGKVPTNRSILPRLDTSATSQSKPVHLRSASVPIHPFVTARPTVLRHRHHHRASSKTESLEDKMDRLYSFSSHPPMSPHPAPQTPLPPIPTTVYSPANMIETPLEPLDESPVLPKETSGPFSPVG